MAALTTERYVTRYEDPANGVCGGGVAASTKIFKGSIVCRNATGYLTKGATSTTLVPMGVARDTVDNSAGANGDLKANLDTGAFEFENSAAGDQITIADLGNDVYIVDDQTVAKTNGSSTRSRAGKLVGINPVNSKPIVRIGVGF